MSGLTDKQVWGRVLEQMAKTGVMTRQQMVAVVDELQSIFDIEARGLSPDALGWRDLVSPFISAKLAGAKQPNYVAFPGLRSGAYQFSPTVEQELPAHYHVDHDYAENTPLYQHVHWIPTTTNTGVVRWGFELAFARGHDQEPLSAPITTYVEQEAGGNLNHKITEDLVGALLPNLEPDSFITVSVFRDATHANDTYPDPVYGIMADLHYLTCRYASLNKAPGFHA